VLGGRVGASGASSTASMESWAVGSSSWQTRAPMREVRYAPMAAIAWDAAAQRIFVMGGAPSSTTTTPLSSVESYSFAAGQWQAEPSLNTARSFGGAAVSSYGPVSGSSYLTVLGGRTGGDGTYISR
jgi:hypothetical protein